MGTASHLHLHELTALFRCDCFCLFPFVFFSSMFSRFFSCPGCGSRCRRERQGAASSRRHRQEPLDGFRDQDAGTDVPDQHAQEKDHQGPSARRNGAVATACLDSKASTTPPQGRLHMPRDRPAWPSGTLCSCNDPLLRMGSDVIFLFACPSALMINRSCRIDGFVSTSSAQKA